MRGGGATHTPSRTPSTPHALHSGGGGGEGRRERERRMWEGEVKREREMRRERGRRMWEGEMGSERER